MVKSSKVLTVSYGTFSCTLEGFDDPFTTMQLVAEYFRDLSAQDRYFGSEPPVPEPAALQRLASAGTNASVEADVNDEGIVLRVTQQDDQPTVLEAASASDPEDDFESEFTEGADDFDQAAQFFRDTRDLDQQDTTDADDDTGEAHDDLGPKNDDRSPATTVEQKLERIREVVQRGAAGLPSTRVDDEPLFEADKTTLDASVEADAAGEKAQRKADRRARKQAEKESKQLEKARLAELAAAELAQKAAAEAQETADREDAERVATAEELAAKEEAEQLAETQAQEEQDATERKAADRAEREARQYAQRQEAQARELEAERARAKEVEAEAEAARLAALEEEAEALEDSDDFDEAELSGDAFTALQAAVASEPDSEPEFAEIDVATIPEAQQNEPEEVEPIFAQVDELDQQRSHRGAALFEDSIAQEEVALSRLMEKTQSKMDEPDQARRQNALSQLKAAVIATEAEREITGSDKSLDRADSLAAMKEFRRDLADVQSTADAAEDRAPLVLVSEQAVDEIDDDRIEDALDHESAAFHESSSFSDFADRIGALALPDLLEAAAAYTSYVEGKPRFSRAQVMSKIAKVDRQASFSKEAGLRSFGKLLREGKILRVQDGQFAISRSSRFAKAAQ
jgi:pilus assembly protein FimV